MCDSPFYVDNPNFPHLSKDPKVPVPCGRCPVCKKRKLVSWTFRLQNEERISTSSFFITLTYDNHNVPLSAAGFPTLRKSDFQDFMKRLRKAHSGSGPSGIKYYAVGEYGGKSWRPHFHALIFNADIEKIHSAWNLGFVHIGRIETASVVYTLKYVWKGKRVPAFKKDDRVPEFSLMSKGLGANYLSPAVVQYHQADISRNYVVNCDGYRLPLPKYYREKIYSKKQMRQQITLVPTKSLVSRFPAE